MAVGALRIEDVAIGCGVSALVGVLFWPRGAAAVVGNDLADAFRRGSEYLGQAVDWALARRRLAPDAGVAAATTGMRVDDALRAFLAEQGAKRVSKQDLWRLVGAAQRLRLTAHSMSALAVPDVEHVPARDELAALADHRVRIPIHGHAESLNLATAAAVCLYASAKAQHPKEIRT